MHRTVSGQPQQVHGGPRACTGVGPTCRDGKAASGLNWAGVCRLAQRRWQSRLPMAVGFEGGTHTASSPPHGDRCGRGGTSRMTIQLTQRWDCGSRDPFRSSGTGLLRRDRRPGVEETGGGGGEGRGQGKVGCGGGGGGWLWQREHSLKDHVSRCCPGVLPRDLEEHPTEGHPTARTGTPKARVPRPGPSQAAQVRKPQWIRPKAFRKGRKTGL